MDITPAIFPENFEQIVDKLFVLEGLCERVQIDLCDGVMGLEKTWLPYEEKELPHGFEYEFDLMVNDWKKYLHRVLALGARRVIMHIDSWHDVDIEQLLEIMGKHTDVALGLSVSNNYDVNDFAEKVRFVALRYARTFIQVMGIRHIGAQGQPFDETTESRIRVLHEACPMLEIQVDGSMNKETAFLVKRAGAGCAVVGSYLFKHGDVKKTLEDLKRSVG
jgi:ribulose-phosphate 3-epimerase